MWRALGLIELRHEMADIVVSIQPCITRISLKRLPKLNGEKRKNGTASSDARGQSRMRVSACVIEVALSLSLSRFNI